MTVRIGFIGTGGIATSHLTRLHGLDGAEVVGLCDVSADRCEAAVQRVNAALDARAQAGVKTALRLRPQVFTDPREMISKAGPDAVFIAVPPFAHGDLERAVIRARKHIFVEKPVALSLDLAMEIESRIRDAGLISAVGYQSRCSDAVRAATARLGGRTVGLVQGNYFGGLPGAPWWRVQAQSGGQLIEQATHTVDLMRLLAGEVETVFAAAATRLLTDVEKLDIFDVNTVSMRFRSGAIGTLSNTCGLDFSGGPDWFHGATVFTRGLVASVWLSQATFWEAGSESVVRAQLDPMLEQDRAFVAAAASGDASGIASDYSNGVATLRVTLAAEESARTGKPVSL